MDSFNRGMIDPSYYGQLVQMLNAEVDFNKILVTLNFADNLIAENYFQGFNSS
jgi:hypothetical protein